MLSKRTLSVLKVTWLPFLRLLEKLHLHDWRENYIQGFINKKDIKKVKTFLIRNGFERNLFAWTDLGEVVNLRKKDGELFHYHLRIFGDGEVRGHYEYNGEAKPLKHLFEAYLVPRRKYFRNLLKRYWIK